MICAKTFSPNKFQKRNSGQRTQYMTRTLFLTCLSRSCNSFYRTTSGQDELHERDRSGNLISGHATLSMNLTSRKQFYHPVILGVQMVLFL